MTKLQKSRTVEINSRSEEDQKQSETPLMMKSSSFYSKKASYQDKLPLAVLNSVANTVLLNAARKSDHFDKDSESESIQNFLVRSISQFSMINSEEHVQNIENELNMIKFKPRPSDIPVSNERLNEEQKTVDKSSLVNSGICNSIKCLNSNKTIRAFESVRNVFDSQSDSEDLVEEGSEWYIEPLSPLHIVFNEIAFLLSFYCVLIAPLHFSIICSTVILVKFDIFVDLFFFVDLIINCFVTFLDKNEKLLTDNKKILMNYLSNWFFLDFLAAFPTTVIFNFLHFLKDKDEETPLCINKALRIFRLIAYMKHTFLVKLLKSCSRKKKETVFKQLEIQSDNSFLIVFFIVFLLMTHIFSCFWIFLGKSFHVSWLEDNKDEEAFDIYLMSLYFVWTSIFTVGYGDFVAKNLEERIFCLFLLSFGIAIYSFSISFIGNLMSKTDKLTKRYKNRVELIGELRQKTNMHVSLYSKILKQLENDFKSDLKGRFGFINELPNKLKNQLIVRMYGDFIDNCNFLRNKGLSFCCDVIMNLRGMQARKGEQIFSTGDKVEEMVFVISGKLAIMFETTTSTKKIIDIMQNEYFGEILALSSQKSPFILQCQIKIATLMFLKKKDLEQISSKYETLFDKIFETSSYNYHILMNKVKERFGEDEMKLRLSSSLVKPRDVKEMIEKVKKENANYPCLRDVKRKSTKTLLKINLRLKTMKMSEKEISENVAKNIGFAIKNTNNDLETKQNFLHSMISELRQLNQQMTI